MSHSTDEKSAPLMTPKGVHPEESRDDLERHLIDAWRRGQSEEAEDED